MINILKKFQPFFNQKWYVQKFNATPNLLDMGARSGLISCWRDLGYGYRMFINVYRRDLCEMHYHRKSLDQIYKEVVNRYRHDHKYLDRVRNLWFSKTRLLKRKYFDKNLDLSRYNFPELIKAYREFYLSYYIESCGIAHILEAVTLTTDTKLKNLILEELHRQENYPSLSTALPILTASIRDTFFNKEQKGLVELINYVKNSKQLSRVFKGGKKRDILRLVSKEPEFKILLDNQVKNFHWVRNSYAGALNLKAWDFLAEIKEFIRLNKKLTVVSSRKPRFNYLAKKAFIKKWKLSKEIQELIYLTDFMTNWQDERKEYTLRAVAVNDEFLLEIGRRVRMPIFLMRYLLIEEFSVDNLKRIKRKELEERRRGCVVVAKRNHFEIVSGRLFKQIVKKLAGRRQTVNIREINGLPGSVGRTIGRVKICLDLNDMNKMKPGDILVTSMTRPEYVPVIKKSGAIVTDEGGITCHAAIVSRELGIPCVIGTKDATTVLKDGDLVEVNANHGLVKILER